MKPNWVFQRGGEGRGGKGGFSNQKMCSV